MTEIRLTMCDFQKIIKRAAEFRELSNAVSWAAMLDKPHRIVMGGCSEIGGVYWVVTPANATRLERMGYEIMR